MNVSTESRFSEVIFENGIIFYLELHKYKMFGLRNIFCTNIPLNDSNIQ